jgi:hypothetical protein
MEMRKERQKNPADKADELQGGIMAVGERTSSVKGDRKALRPFGLAFVIHRF